MASIAAGCAGNHCISQGSELGVLYFSLKAWNLAQRAQRPNAWASGVLGYSLTLLGFAGVARSYFAASEFNRPTRHDGSYAIIKMAFFVGVGELPAAEALIRDGFERVPHGGYDSSAPYRWFVLGHCALLRGDLAEAEECFAHATKVEGPRANFWPALAFARALAGRFRDAEPLLDESLREANPPTPRGIAFGVLALIQALGDDVAAALRSADQAVALVGGDRTFGFSGSPYFAGIFEAFLAEFEQARSDGRPTGPALGRLRRIARQCRSWARVFRVGRPLSLLYDGKIAKLLGRPRRAQRLWEQSRELSCSMDLHFYAALAARELDAMSTEDALGRRARANSPT